LEDKLSSFFGLATCAGRAQDDGCVHYLFNISIAFLRFSVGFCGAAISQGAKLHPAKPENQSPQKGWTRNLAQVLGQEDNLFYNS
jgi:hypothetical protein